MRRSITRLFETLPHVRTLNRGGKTEYQYRRDVNPKPLRPIASEVFGKWTVVRALHTEADYHAAALEYDRSSPAAGWWPIPSSN